jgi:Peptidase family M23
MGAKKQIILFGLFLAQASGQGLADPKQSHDFFAPLTDGDGLRYPSIIAPLIWEVLGRVTAVSGTDGRVHLAYAARFTNQSSTPATLEKLIVIDPERANQPTGRNEVVTIKGEDVSGKFMLFSTPATMEKNNYSSDLTAGASAAVFFDVTYAQMGDVPRRISHAVTVTKPFGKEGMEQPVIHTPVEVDRSGPVVLSPPLKGSHWLNGNGCCRQIGPHRFTLSPINGAISPVETFAIDFVQLNAAGKLYSGPITDVKSYLSYGVDVLAAGAGTVVEVVRDRPDEVPGKNPPFTTIANVLGNHVIIDMGNGHYAFYAHMAPSSVSLHVGDYVRQGTRLGALGNSGNSDGPHLHFQVMDQPSALGANPLPFVFDTFKLEGRFTGSMAEAEARFLSGKPLEFHSEGSVTFRKTMPLTFDLIAFQ